MLELHIHIPVRLQQFLVGNFSVLSRKEMKTETACFACMVGMQVICHISINNYCRIATLCCKENRVAARQYCVDCTYHGQGQGPIHGQSLTLKSTCIYSTFFFLRAIKMKITKKSQISQVRKIYYQQQIRTTTSATFTMHTHIKHIFKARIMQSQRNATG